MYSVYTVPLKKSIYICKIYLYSVYTALGIPSRLWQEWENKSNQLNYNWIKMKNTFSDRGSWSQNTNVLIPFLSNLKGRIWEKLKAYVEKLKAYVEKHLMVIITTNLTSICCVKRRNFLKTTQTEERPYTFRKLKYSTRIVKQSISFQANHKAKITAEIFDVVKLVVTEKRRILLLF